MDTDQKYLQADSGANRDDGCTAVTAVLVGQNLIVANVGDSRAVLSKGGQGKPSKLAVLANVYMLKSLRTFHLWHMGSNSTWECQHARSLTPTAASVNRLRKQEQVCRVQMRMTTQRRHVASKHFTSMCVYPSVRV